MTLGSLFDGSGGFPLGAVLTGIEPLWASEVEPFPIRVTTKRLPNMKHLGDICKLDGSKVPPVDIITAGFCCQDLSMAGKRAGLHGERSGLFFQVIRIIKEMRETTNNEYPKYAVLENVPGIYSSNKGLDFLEVLNELIHIKDEALSIPMPESGRWSTAGEVVGDGVSLAWRTLDAQFWGVAQKRRRMYLVVDFTGERAGEILFDETRLSGDFTACGAEGQATARSVAAGSGGSTIIPCRISGYGRYVIDYATAPTLTASHDDTIGLVITPCGVRSYTIREVLTLQGMPPDWCDDIPGATPCAVRRLMGNGVALPCVIYVLSGIVRQHALARLGRMGSNKGRAK